MLPLAVSLDTNGIQTLHQVKKKLGNLETTSWSLISQNTPHILHLDYINTLIYIAIYCMMPCKSSLPNPSQVFHMQVDRPQLDRIPSHLGFRDLRIPSGTIVNCRPLGDPDKIVIPLYSVRLFTNPVSAALGLQ